MTELRPHASIIRPPLPPGDLWVFAYGSLLWRPGFEFSQRLPARLFGYHRALCVWSHVHRGTPKQPGMVLGLDHGGSCQGCVYRVPAAQKNAVAEYLYAREMPTPIYHARLCRVQLTESSPVTALTFVVNRRNPQYAGHQPASTAASHIAKAQGISGSSQDYLRNTLDHLDELGLYDPHLHAIWQALSPAADLDQCAPTAGNAILR